MKDYNKESELKEQFDKKRRARQWADFGNGCFYVLIIVAISYFLGHILHYFINLI